MRERPLQERRELLAGVLADAGSPRLLLSQEVAAASWDAAALRREDARELGVEGLMLKRRSSPYQVGRRRGDWWKWKIEPFTMDAVLVYAQPGSGRRATVFTDYTFAVWDNGELVPVAKAYSGLSDEEIDELEQAGVSVRERLLVMSDETRSRCSTAARFAIAACWRIPTGGTRCGTQCASPSGRCSGKPCWAWSWRWSLECRVPRRGIVRAAILIPWAIPTIVSAKMWSWMLNDQFGIINDLGMKLGLLLGL